MKVGFEPPKRVTLVLCPSAFLENVTRNLKFSRILGIESYMDDRNLAPFFPVTVPLYIFSPRVSAS